MHAYLKNLSSFEAQYTARTAYDTFTTGQAVAILNRHTKPGVAANVNINGAMIRANAALYAALTCRDDLSLRSSRLMKFIHAKQVF
jgi:phage terminase large subunit-like protein